MTDTKIKQQMGHDSKMGQISDLLNHRQAAEYLGYTAAYLYQLTSKRQIPFCKAGGKGKNIFRRSELDEWIENGRQLTQDEIGNRASDYMMSSSKPSSGGR